MARPIVATRVAGLPEVVINQQMGILTENDNSQASANAMAFLLEHPERAIQIGGPHSIGSGGISLSSDTWMHMTCFIRN
jgi:glycosyltransferase involved in cell wall biosynthesis